MGKQGPPEGSEYEYKSIAEMEGFEDITTVSQDSHRIDYKVNAGISVKLSTKQMLLWATEIYGVKAQSDLAEKILLKTKHI